MTTAPEKPNSTNSSILASVPLLEYKDQHSPNFSTWKEAMTTYCGAEYGRLSCIIRDGTEPPPLYPPDLTVYDKTNDPSGALSRSQVLKEKLNMEDESKLINLKHKMFHVIISKLSINSKFIAIISIKAI